VARVIREDFLQQHAYQSVDAFCPAEKQYWMLRAILTFNQVLADALQRGVTLDDAMAIPEIAELGRMKEWAMPEARERIGALTERLRQAFAGL
jgi:V/A-type H+-transporting ATPase subunit A